MSEEKYIIIFAIKHDHHVDRVVEHIERRNGLVLRLNVDEVTDWRLSFSDGKVWVKIEDIVLSQTEIKSVFVRRLPTFEAFLQAVKEEYREYAEFIAKQEFQLFSDCLAVLDEHLFFMNPMQCAKYFGKAVQSDVAIRSGLLVPETYIGSDPEIARSFVRELRRSGKRVSTKPISNVKVSIDGVQSVRFTELLSGDDEAHLETLTDCPVIFQEYVEKQYEIRGAFVTGNILASSIHSQEAEGRTSIDWRHYNLAQTPHYAIELPADLQMRLVHFHRALGVHYSSFDLIVTPTNEYYFLETNPFGQWLWIEDLTGLPITSQVVDALLGASAS